MKYNFEDDSIKIIFLTKLIRYLFEMQQTSSNSCYFHFYYSALIFQGKCTRRFPKKNLSSSEMFCSSRLWSFLRLYILFWHPGSCWIYAITGVLDKLVLSPMIKASFFLQTYCIILSLLKNLPTWLSNKMVWQNWL